jgi:hypothetical protein
MPSRLALLGRRLRSQLDRCSFAFSVERVLYGGHVDVVAYFARLQVNQIKLDGFTLLFCAVVYLISLHLPLFSQ